MLRYGFHFHVLCFCVLAEECNDACKDFCNVGKELDECVQVFVIAGDIRVVIHVGYLLSGIWFYQCGFQIKTGQLRKNGTYNSNIAQ